MPYSNLAWGQHTYPSALDIERAFPETLDSPTGSRNICRIRGLGDEVKLAVFARVRKSTLECPGPISAKLLTTAGVGAGRSARYLV